MKITLCAVVLLMPLLAVSEEVCKLAVIVNKKNNINTLSQPDLKRIFLKKRKVWHKGTYSGEIITVVNQPYTRNISRQFTEKVLKMDINNVKKYWTEQRYKGGELHPEVRHNTQSVIDFVKKNDKAVAYTVFAKELLESSGVKVIATFEITPLKEVQSARAMMESLKYLSNFNKKKINIHVIGDDDVFDAFLILAGKYAGYEILLVKASSQNGGSKPDLIFIGRNSNISSTIKYAAKEKILTMTNSPKIFEEGVNLGVSSKNGGVRVQYSNCNGFSWKSGIKNLESELK